MQYYKIVHLWMKMLQNTTLTFPSASFEEGRGSNLWFSFANSAYFCKLKTTSKRNVLNPDYLQSHVFTIWTVTIFSFLYREFYNV